MQILCEQTSASSALPTFVLYAANVRKPPIHANNTFSNRKKANRMSLIFSLGDAKGSGSRVLTYDGSGNVITDTSGGVTKTYAYNAANRMESLTIGSDVTEYVYNALGQLVIRTLPSGQVIHVVHDYDGNRLAEYDYDATTDTSTLLREYVWLDGEAVGVVENDVFYFVRTDHIGRPVFATDDTGTVQWTASYKPFGSVQTSTGNPIELRFPGQWYQSESGLHQNWRREFDPTTGRYSEMAHSWPSR
jgi:YD repeat-containing protein